MQEVVHKFSSLLSLVGSTDWVVEFQVTSPFSLCLRLKFCNSNATLNDGIATGLLQLQRREIQVLGLHTSARYLPRLDSAAVRSFVVRKKLPPFVRILWTTALNL